jgi:hypothetical protein
MRLVDAVTRSVILSRRNVLLLTLTPLFLLVLSVKSAAYHIILTAMSNGAPCSSRISCSTASASSSA